MLNEFEKVCQRAEAIRRSEEAVAQDARHARIRMARAGNLQLIAPDAFSEEWPAPVIANFIDVAGYRGVVGSASHSVV
jgi:hypothetical protein